VFVTQLHIAAANGYLRVVEFLLDHNVATNVKDNDDWQPVHAAACWGHVSIFSTDRTCSVHW
jgi:protein phosphatase 1 regulatory subunit 16A